MDVGYAKILGLALERYSNLGACKQGIRPRSKMKSGELP